MRVSILAFLAALPLAACGQPGPSEEMRTSDGTANAPGTVIPDEPPVDETLEGAPAADVGDALQPGGDGNAPQAMTDGPGGNMVRDGVAYTPGINPGGGALDGFVDADYRSDEDKVRDRYRHPAETLEFFGLEPDMTVVEVWPGGGWYTQIIAPYLAQGGGTYYAAGFDPNTDSQRVRENIARFENQFSDEDVYGDVNMTVLSAEDTEVAPAGSADMVLTFRNVHNFVMNGFAEQAFAGFYEALKPGGILGVVDHRLPEEADAGMEESSGYLKPSTIRRLAEDAGFEFVAESEVNANPNDDADHPFGVWTLPPTSRAEGNGVTLTEDEVATFAAIGESDRLTMKFVKPLGADGALME